MAVNFKIDKHRSNDTLEIVLKGDLDGSSAWAVIHEIKKSCSGLHRVVIQTKCLSHVWAFGYGILIKNLYMIKRPLRIVSKEPHTGRIVLEFMPNHNCLKTGAGSHRKEVCLP